MATSSNTESGDVSLLQFLDLPQLVCLNESSDHTLKSILEGRSRNTSSNFLESDADEQLLLTIPFNQAVRIRSIIIQSSEEDSAPKEIKLLTNRPALGFEDVEDAVEPSVAQIIDLSKDDVTNGTKLKLRFVRFQTVNSLHIFVASNQGAVDQTKIHSLDILGVPIAVTKDLIGLKQTEE